MIRHAVFEGETEGKCCSESNDNEENDPRDFCSGCESLFHDDDTPGGIICIDDPQLGPVLFVNQSYFYHMVAARSRSESNNEKEHDMVES